MLRTSSLYPLSRELKRRLPSVQGRLRRDLALWVKGTILAHNGCQDSAAALLGHVRALRNPAPGTAGVDLRRRGSGSVLGAGDGGGREGLPPGQLRRPPTEAPRRFSVLRQGTACLRLLARNRPVGPRPAHPQLGPDRTAGLRCLSPPAA